MEGIFFLPLPQHCMDFTLMGFNNYYYHIKLDADAQKLCTIVFP
jgi:hypothetical protein